MSEPKMVPCPCMCGNCTAMVPCFNPAESMHCRCWEDGGPCCRCGDDSDGEDGDECP